MERFIRASTWILAVVLLGYNLYLWGGLAVTPGIGPKLREQASVESPIAATYLFLGRHAVGQAGRNDQARGFAARRFPDQVNDPALPRAVVLTRVLSAQSAVGRLAYYAAPLLLLLSLVLHARRPKQIRSFGTKG